MALPKLEDWKAPWEVDLKEGDDPKDAIDPEKLKRYLHGVLGDKDKLKDQVTTVTAERDGYKTKVEEHERAGETELQKAIRERDEALAKAAQPSSEPTPRELKLEIALTKGLTARQAERLVGTTREELEADADAFLEESGANVGSGDGSGEDGGSSDTPRATPASRLRSAGDPAGGAEPVFDPDKEADAYLGQRFI